MGHNNAEAVSALIVRLKFSDLKHGSCFVCQVHLSLSGGGGMFAVPDEASLKSKTTAKTPEQPTAKVSKKAYNVAPISLKVAEGQSRDEAWDQYFSTVEIKTAEDLTVLDQKVRATVGLLSAKSGKAQDAGDTEQAVEYFAQARDAIAGAIRAGHVQPWMYHAYAIALKATSAPTDEVERALLSAVDFAESPEEILNVAARLEDVGSDQAALRLCKYVTNIDPYRREAYVIGLRIARRLNDVEGLKWSCKGVLSHAWPEKFQSVVDEARLVSVLHPPGQTWLPSGG